MSAAREARWDPGLYDSVHHYVADYGRSLLEWLDPKPGERILDLGCGTGTLTHAIAERGASVVGVDSSPEMVGQARQSYSKLEFHLADARSFRSPQPFDKVFSNAVLHWVKPPEDAIITVRENLRPKGLLVAEFGGLGNIASIIEAAGFNPWYFPGIGEYATRLERHGFTVTQASLFDRPTPVPGENGMREWLTMFFKSALSPADLQRIEAELRPRLFREGTWVIDYTRLRIAARAG